MNIPDCNYQRRTGGKGNGRWLCGCASCEVWRNAKVAQARRGRERRHQQYLTRIARESK